MNWDEYGMQIAQVAAYQIKRVLYKDIYNYDTSSLLTAKKLGIELVQYE